MSIDHNDARAARFLIGCLAEGRDPYLIPRESLRTPSHGVVDGWVIINGPERDFTVTRPGGAAEQMDRPALVAVLRAEWMEAARAVAAVKAPAATRATMTDGITEARRETEERPPAAQTASAPDVSQQARRFLAEMQDAMQAFVEANVEDGGDVTKHKARMSGILDRLGQAQRDLRAATRAHP